MYEGRIKVYSKETPQPLVHLVKFLCPRRQWGGQPCTKPGLLCFSPAPLVQTRAAHQHTDKPLEESETQPAKMRSRRGNQAWMYATACTFLVLADLAAACTMETRRKRSTQVLPKPRAPNETADNWVQINGPPEQDEVTPLHTEMSPRFGAGYAVMMKNFTASGDLIPESQRVKFFVIGGDDYNFDSGSGGYRNDVWFLQSAGEGVPGLCAPLTSCPHHWRRQHHRSARGDKDQ